MLTSTLNTLRRQCTPSRLQVHHVHQHLEHSSSAMYSQSQLQPAHQLREGQETSVAPDTACRVDMSVKVTDALPTSGTRALPPSRALSSPALLVVPTTAARSLLLLPVLLDGGRQC